MKATENSDIQPAYHYAVEVELQSTGPLYKVSEYCVTAPTMEPNRTGWHAFATTGQEIEAAVAKRKMHRRQYNALCAAYEGYVL